VVVLLYSQQACLTLAWDLDVNVIRIKEQARNWNWELLVRKLSQLKIHEPGDTSLELPLQLKNRRRIWRLLEEARVGDYAEWQNKNVAEGREQHRKELLELENAERVESWTS
jgi:hypothetical protein